VTRLKWKLDSLRLEMVLLLMQDRSMVSTEHSTRIEIILDALDGSPS
jgi:hypothetical protein